MDENTKYLWDRRFKALHCAVANRLYQQSSAAIFEQRDRWAKLVSIIGASGVFVTVTSTGIAQWWAVVAFAGVTASLVFQWSEKSRRATERMMRYAQIEADIEEAGERDFSEVQINRWEAQMSAIQEPEANQMLWKRVCNRASQALGVDNQPLSWWGKHAPIWLLP